MDVGRAYILIFRHQNIGQNSMIPNRLSSSISNLGSLFTSVSRFLAPVGTYFVCVLFTSVYFFRPKLSGNAVYCFCPHYLTAICSLNTTKEKSVSYILIHELF